jgi:hypothetical protein
MPQMAHTQSGGCREAVHELCVLQSFEEDLQGMLFVCDGYFTNGTLHPLAPCP